jgi:hypothetical protein
MNNVDDDLRFYVNYDDGEDEFNLVPLPLRMVVGQILQSLNITMTKLVSKDALIVRQAGIKIYPRDKRAS